MVSCLVWQKPLQYSLEEKIGRPDLLVGREKEFANFNKLVILDEFQSCAVHVYPDANFQTKPIDSMPGSYHSLSESKVAPMLVTGSYKERPTSGFVVYRTARLI